MAKHPYGALPTVSTSAKRETSNSSESNHWLFGDMSFVPLKPNARAQLWVHIIGIALLTAAATSSAEVTTGVALGNIALLAAAPALFAALRYWTDQRLPTVS